MKRYKVLWIDDEPEKQDGFFEEAFLEQIDVYNFKTSKLGMEELSSKTEQYDAVILDALVYDQSEDESADLGGLYNSISIIKSLSNTKKIPYFIFSAYIHSDKFDQVRKLLSKENIFIKVKENKALFRAIKEAADEQETTQLKHKYPNVFAICDDNYIGSKEFKRILQLIKDIENPEDIFNQQDALSPMRKVLEAIFKKLNEIGLIPDEIQNGSGAINGASIFLAGNNKGYNYNEELIHPVIAESIRHLIGLTQDASHNEGNKLRADSYLANSSNTYLYRALCYSLIEVLEYLKPFLDENLDQTSNQSKWDVINSRTISSNDWIKGNVLRVVNDYGTFQSVNRSVTLTILPNKMDEYSLKEGDNIEVTTKPSRCGTKTHIKEIKKVN
jgi:hypothetical protein